MGISYQKTPIIQLKNSIFEQQGIVFYIKREDLNHPFISGNKWWKLKYNLEEATGCGSTTLLTFGGAFSNHLFATAAAAHELGIKSIGIVRGEETLPINSTLRFARDCGMALHYVSREEYRNKTQLQFIQRLHDQFGDFYLIPEGGTNALAIKGCSEFAIELAQELSFDYVCLPVGTGGTMAGMLEGFQGTKNVMGFPVIKGAAYLEDEIRRYTSYTNWQLHHDYHFGGYAKSTPQLLSFVHQIENEFQVPFDPVYTGKMLFGIFDLVQKSFFPRGSTVLALHTGGLQGRNA